MNLPDQHFSLQIIELVVHKETLQFSFLSYSALAGACKKSIGEKECAVKVDKLMEY